MSLTGSTEHAYQAEDVEGLLVERQGDAYNLTSFVVYPLPSCLMEVPYPTDVAGRLIEPALLRLHSQTHDFAMPKCFHGKEARFVANRDTFTGEECAVELVCNEEDECYRCRFRVDLKMIFARGGPLHCVRYNARPLKSDGTSDSSSGLSTPESVSSSDSNRKRQRTNVPFLPTGCSDTKARTYGGFHSEALLDDKRPKPSLDTQQDVGYQCHRHDTRAPQTIPALEEDIKPLSHRQTEACGSLNDAPATEVVTRAKGRRTTNKRSIHVKVSRPREIDTNNYDDDVYPLLARGDGTSSSLIHCLDPVTHEFSNDLFLHQIIKDASSRAGKKAVTY